MADEKPTYTRSSKGEIRATGDRSTVVKTNPKAPKGKSK